MSPHLCRGPLSVGTGGSRGSVGRGLGGVRLWPTALHYPGRGPHTTAPPCPPPPPSCSQAEPRSLGGPRPGLEQQLGSVESRGSAWSIWVGCEGHWGELPPQIPLTCAQEPQEKKGGSAEASQGHPESSGVTARFPPLDPLPSLRLLLCSWALFSPLSVSFCFSLSRNGSLCPLAQVSCSALWIPQFPLRLLLCLP